MQRRAFLAHVHVFSTFRTTVWKFHEFSITQILREINFGDFEAPSKPAILTILAALDFEFLRCRVKMALSKFLNFS